LGNRSFGIRNGKNLCDSVSTSFVDRSGIAGEKEDQNFEYSKRRKEKKKEKKD
jgi:hypothetical protein